LNPCLAPLFGQIEFGPLSVRRFGSCLPALALAEPVFIFLEFAFDLSLFERAPSDLYLIGCEYNIVRRFGQVLCVIVVPVRRVPSRWSGLSWQGAGNLG
jgi:hypothetical protein